MQFSKNEHELTLEDKVDYIYRELKRDEANRTFNRIWGWFWKIVTIISIGLLYFQMGAITEKLMSGGMNSLMGNPNSLNLSGLPSDLTGK
jgi:hypothetical protein